MLQLLNPIWLFTMLGIIIPLIIHLWNVKKGKTLKIGSIQLFGEQSQKSARSLKLIDLLLLFLRCLLLILLALVLSKPVWDSFNKEKQKSGWLIIEGEFSKEIYGSFKSEIDSLINLGYEVHYFEPDFRKIKSSEIVSQSSNTTPKNSSSSYWSLISLLNEKIPQNTEVFLYTSNRLNSLGSKRPEISFKLIWKTISPTDSLGNWIEKAWFEDFGKIQVIIANSSPSKTTYTYESIDPSIKNNRFILNFEDGEAKLSFKDQIKKDSNSIIIDTSSIKIAIYQDKFKLDISYLTAGIEAIQSFTKRKIEIKRFDSKTIPSGFDFIFWLSEDEIPKSIKPKNVLFSYAKGEIISEKTHLITDKSKSNIEIELYKKIKAIANTYPTISIWEDGFGNPILNKTYKKNYIELKFYSRFNPEWNDLVWSNDFPRILMGIILSPESRLNHLDKRRVSAEQMKPVHKPMKEKLKIKRAQNEKNLENQIWLALILIFTLERYLSFKKNLND